jgi:hypothetical protein
LELEEDIVSALAVAHSLGLCGNIEPLRLVPVVLGIFVLSDEWLPRRAHVARVRRESAVDVSGAWIIEDRAWLANLGELRVGDDPRVDGFDAVPFPLWRLTLQPVHIESGACLVDDFVTPDAVDLNFVNV